MLCRAPHVADRLADRRASVVRPSVDPLSTTDRHMAPSCVTASLGHRLSGTRGRRALERFLDGRHLPERPELHREIATG